MTAGLIPVISIAASLATSGAPPPTSWERVPQQLMSDEGCSLLVITEMDERLVDGRPVASGMGLCEDQRVFRITGPLQDGSFLLVLEAGHA